MLNPTPRIALLNTGCTWNHFLAAGTTYGQIWQFWVEIGHFRGLLGHPRAIFLGAKRFQQTPPDVRYNVQPCSTNVQPIWGSWNHLWPNMAILGPNWAFSGPSGAPEGHFYGGKKVPTDPPGCEIQCSTVFNQCSTHLRQLEPLMAKYGNFGPKLAIKWQ